MLIDIHIKFCEDIVNSFQVIEWTHYLWWTKFQGNNSKSINARVMVLALCMSSNVDWYLHDIEVILEQVSSYRAHTILWWTKFQGKLLKKYKCKSYGSCALYVVLHWLIFIWSLVKIALMVFKLWSENDFVTESKGNNSKCINARVTLLALCASFNVTW